MSSPRPCGVTNHLALDSSDVRRPYKCSLGRAQFVKEPEVTSILVETRGPIVIVTINRPAARNAVDRPTGAALVEAFRAFDGDDTRSVAILTGAAGTFCAGADLKAMAEGRRNPLQEEGIAPMGPTRMMLSKPVLA